MALAFSFPAWTCGVIGLIVVAEATYHALDSRRLITNQSIDLLKAYNAHPIQ